MSWPANNQIPGTNTIPIMQTPMDYTFGFQAMTPEQQFANWQQWQNYQQQYAQWHAQYGEQYAKLQGIQQAQIQQQPPIPYAQPVPPPPPEEPEKPPEPTIQPVTNTENSPQKPSQTKMIEVSKQNKDDHHSYKNQYQRDDNNRWMDNRKWNQNQINSNSSNHDNSNRNTYNSNHGNNYNHNRNNNRKMNHNNNNNRNFQNNTAPSDNNSNNHSSTNSMSTKAPILENVIDEIQDLLTDEEIAFDLQFKKWEEEGENWKKQNANHPDRKAYEDYKTKFEEVRKNLLERRNQMRKNKIEQQKNSSIRRNDPNKMDQNSNSPFSNSDHNAREYFDNTPNQGSFISTSAEKLFSSSKSGIPGLDLVPDKPEESSETNEESDAAVTALINLDDEPQQTELDSSTAHKEENKMKMKNFVALTAKDTSATARDMDSTSRRSNQQNIPASINSQLAAHSSNAHQSPHSRDQTHLPPLQTQTQSKTDFSALSQGINQLLGDQNLLNLLSFVKEGKINQQVTNSGLNPILSALEQISGKQDGYEQTESTEKINDSWDNRFNYDNNEYSNTPNFRNFNDKKNNNNINNHNDDLHNRMDERDIFHNNRNRSFSESSNPENNNNNINNRRSNVNVWEADNQRDNAMPQQAYIEPNVSRTNVQLQNHSVWAFNEDFSSNSNANNKSNNNININNNNNNNKNNRISNSNNKNNNKNNINFSGNFNNTGRKSDNDAKINDSFDNRSNNSGSFKRSNNNIPKIRSLLDIDPFECNKSMDSNRSSNYDQFNINNDNYNQNNDNYNQNNDNYKQINDNYKQNNDNFMIDDYENRPFSRDSDTACSNFQEYDNSNKNTQNNKIQIPEEDDDEFFRPVQVIDYQNKPTQWRTEIIPAEKKQEDILVPETIIDYGHKAIVVVQPKSILENLEELPEYKPAEIIDYQHSVERVHETHGCNFSPNTINLFDKCMAKKRKYLENISIKYGKKFDPKLLGSMDNVTKDIRQPLVTSPVVQQAPLPPVVEDDVNASYPAYPGKWTLLNKDRPFKLPTKRGKRSNMLRKKGKLIKSEAVEKTEDFEDISSCEENENDDIIEIFDDDPKDIKNLYPQRKIERPIATSSSKQVLFKNAIPMDPYNNSNIILIEDILLYPGRRSRPSKIVIILRGPPGSGKTYLSKLIKDKEVEMGGSNPRILNIDDYFVTETESVEKCPETGRKLLSKKMVYEYDSSMEEQYMQYLVKSYKKTITDGLFDFIIVDCINQTLDHYLDIYNFGKMHGFSIFTCQLEMNVQTCFNRNVHNRTENEIKEIVDNWVDTPEQNLILNPEYLLSNTLTEIIEIEMEDVSNDEDELTNPAGDDDKTNESAKLYSDEEDDTFGLFKSSKWDTDPSEQKLARLDGINKPLKHTTFEDYLQIDGWEPPNIGKPGQKRVRWADLEEKRAQDKMRAIGFVVGQTDWKRMMDPTEGSSALTQTKYIERVRKD